ncbi:MAG TPA: LysR family transcriptional regulator [Usitatibacter sp.]|nr:LysR family transcriptional regulator [Usitatibacter sp.]
MKHISRRQLRVFAAVVAEQSFSGAAKMLHLTQPAISLQVKELEQSCGLSLLERSGRRIRPTEAGREMLRAAHAVERELKQAEDAVSALKGLRGGMLTVGVISTAQYFAPRLLTAFCGRHTDVKLRLDVCNREAMLHHLDEDDIDIAIMGRPPSEIETTAEPFAPNPHIILAAPGHRLVGRRHVALRELLDEPFIAREPGSGTRLLADALFAKHRLAFLPALVMSSNETIKQAVMAGMAISLLSLHTVGLEVATGALKVLDVEDLPIVRRWYLVHRRDKRLSPAALAFREFVLREAGAFVEALMAPAIAGAKLDHRRLSKSPRGPP